MEGEIFVVTGYGHGHIQPCLELCKHLSSRNYFTTLIFPSVLRSAIPSSFTQRPRTRTLEISSSERPTHGSDPSRQEYERELQSLLDRHLEVLDSPVPLRAVVDFQMGWARGLFWKLNIPVISLFTFGASAAAMEWGAWKLHASDMKPGEVRLIPGLPEEMALTYPDLKRKFSRPRSGDPPKPSDKPPWVREIEGSIALMFNTCEDLDGPFLKYVADQMGMPAWGVGPLLPKQYWKSYGCLIRDREAREQNRRSSLTEEDVILWLDTKPRGSVLYVAFGSILGPTREEYSELAHALDESTRPFIWVIRPESGSEHYFPHELNNKVGGRGLILYGWAPQLLILSHKSTGGFLSHCGWNSMVEAIGRGVPILCWPIRGDQLFNAKLAVSCLKVGHKIADDLSEIVKKDDMVRGIERVMSDIEMKNRAEQLSAKFEHGFPASSAAALDAFSDFMKQINEKLTK